YRAGTRCARRPPEVLRPLVEGDVCWTAPAGHPGRRLDLWAVGGVLHAAEAHPYALLLDWVGWPAVREAFDPDPQRARGFLAVPDGARGGGTFLIRELAFRRAGGLPRLLARLAVESAGDGLGFLDWLDGAAACAVLAELLTLEAGPRRRFSESKTRRLAE